VHLDDRGRLAVRDGRQALRRDAEVTGLAVQLDYILLRSGVSARDGGDEQPLAEADFNWFEKRRKPALDEVRDRLELVQRTGPVHLGQNANQLVPAARGLHLVQVRSELNEPHSCSP